MKAAPALPVPASVDTSEHYQKQISELQREVAELREKNAQLKSMAEQVSKNSSVPEPNQKIEIPSILDVQDSTEPALISPFYLPTPGDLLTTEQLTELKSGMITFNPTSIPSSEIPVTNETLLQIGQDLQMKWGSTWWAATVVGFDPDGGIRMHYFGWDSMYDEIVPRSDLQLDTGVRQKAIQTVYQLPSN